MTLKRNTLGATGIQVTELCLGTLIYGPLQADMEPGDAAVSIRAALDAGITFVDTAHTYGTYRHLRQGLEGYPDTVVASKSPAKTAQDMRRDIKTCLAELDRDVIDIFHLHLVRGREDMASRAGALDALCAARDEWLIRASGLTAHGLEGLECALETPEIDVVMPLLNRKGLGISDGSPREIIGILGKLRERNVGLYDMKPLGGGHLIDSIPESIGYLRDLGLFDAISVGMKTPAEIALMAGVFENDPAALKRARQIGEDKAAKKRLIIYEFLCAQCGACIDECAQGALSMGAKRPEIDRERCILCGYCGAVCPKFAIRVI